MFKLPTFPEVPDTIKIPSLKYNNCALKSCKPISNNTWKRYLQKYRMTHNKKRKIHAPACV